MNPTELHVCLIRATAYSIDACLLPTILRSPILPTACIYIYCRLPGYYCPLPTVLPTVLYCLLPTAYRLLPTRILYCLLPIRLPTAYRLRVPHMPPTAYTAYCLLPTAYCLRTAYCLLPTAYCLLLDAYCLLPTAYCLYCLLPAAAWDHHCLESTPLLGRVPPKGLIFVSASE